MTNRRSGFLAPTFWSREELDADRLRAVAAFRRERLEEPLEEYLEVFEQVQGTMENLLEGTVDLSLLEDQALEILKDRALREAFRYLAGPPISLDDLKTLVDTNSLSQKALRSDPDLVRRLVETIRTGHDRRRFPWVSEEREPTPSEREAAIIASAALIATRRGETNRRNSGKQAQEELVRQALARSGLTQIEAPGRRISTLASAPQPGEFCPVEVTLGNRKADLAVGLWDGRVMPIECKVSNSSTNSIKRLSGDAAAKAEVWRHDFGYTQVVPVAVLSGVYALRTLEDAQQRGLTLYWAHRLDDLVRWIDKTRQSP